MLGRWIRTRGADVRHRPTGAAPRRLRPASAPAEPLEPRTLLSVAPAGSEFLVNTTTASDQTAPSVASGPDGSFVVAWQGPDADGTGVYARRFDASGAAAGAEFLVNTTTALNQDRPSAAAVAGGGCVVVWRGAGGGATNIFARRFDATGAALGTELRVDTFSGGQHASPAVAADPSGRYVIVWADNFSDGDSWGIFGRRFAADGAPLEAVEFRVNTRVAGSQTAPSVATDGAGGFVVAWQSTDPDTGDASVVARRFTAGGSPQGDEFDVTTAPVPAVLPEPAVAVQAGGAFAVAWQAPGPGGSGFGAYLRAYDSAGAAQSNPVPISAGALGQPVLPAVAALGNGDVLVTWQDDSAAGSAPDVRARIVDAAGAVTEGAFAVNTTLAGEQSAPVVSADPNGKAVVVWRSLGQDGDGFGVFAQRLAVAAANEAPVAGNVPPVSVAEDSPDRAVSLFDAFSDSTDPDSALTYSVTSNTNPSLFVSTTIDPATGLLTLAFAPDASGAASLTVRATDTGGLWAETTFPVTVAAVNDAPVNVVPAPQETPAGTPLVFAAVHHNRIGVDDVDAGSGPIRVALSASNGTLTLATLAGVSFTAGDGTGDSSMTFSGTPAAINAALDGMRFDPTPGFSGAASVTLTSDDLGRTGDGGAKSDTDTVAVTVAGTLPPPSVSVAGATVTEPDAGATAAAVFTLTLSEARPYAVSVDYATQNGAAGVPGTATSPADYSAASGTVTFAPGETTKTVTVTVAGDALNELEEGYSLVLSNPSGATIQTASAAGRITDNDPQPSMSIGDAVVTEGTAPGATAVAQFPVTLSAPSGQLIRVIAQLGGGGGDTATRRLDYDGASEIMTFQPGETSKIVSIPIIGDALDEADETLSIILGYISTPNFAIGDGLAFGTILDDDPTPAVAIGDVTVTEGDAGAGTIASLAVTLSAPSGQTVSVHYVTQDDSATAPGDYTTTVGTLTFAPGETFKTIQVPVKGDATDETDESFNVFLNTPVNVTFADSRGVVHVRNDDAPPVVSAADVAVSEGTSAGGRLVDVTVSLSAVSGRSVRVDYSTVDGTAVSGGDYTAASGTLIFAPGETTKTIQIQVVGDGDAEADESFRVVLSNPDNATAADGGGVVTLRNDDLPLMTVSDAAVAEGDAGTRQVGFVVSLSGVSASPVTVRFATADGTATAGVDYDAATGTLTFAPGEMVKTVLVTVRGDLAVESDESFTLALSAPEGATLADGTATGTITNDDSDSPAPHAVEVFLNGTTWTQSFRDAIAAAGLGSARFGYSVPAGGGQLADLPWANLDQVTVRFDADVVATADDLSVRGVNVPAYAVRAFAYDPASRTATWTLAQPLGRDKVLLDLDGDATGVATAAGVRLDGEWANGSDAFPSGDGAGGGDFEFRVNVLPADTDRNGRVNGLDFFQVRQKLFTSAARPGTGANRYGVFHDLTADGRIDSRDLAAARRGQFTALPSGEPSGADGGSAPGATKALLFSATPILV